MPNIRLKKITEIFAEQPSTTTTGSNIFISVIMVVVVITIYILDGFWAYLNSTVIFYTLSSILLNLLGSIYISKCFA